MSYVLCSCDDCYHHDGDNCTLECVEVNKETSRSKAPTCQDYEPAYERSEDGD